MGLNIEMILTVDETIHRPKFFLVIHLCPVYDGVILVSKVLLALELKVYMILIIFIEFE